MTALTNRKRPDDLKTGGPQTRSKTRRLEEEGNSPREEEGNSPGKEEGKSPCKCDLCSGKNPNKPGIRPRPRRGRGRGRGRGRTLPPGYGYRTLRISLDFHGKFHAVFSKDLIHEMECSLCGKMGDHMVFDCPLPFPWAKTSESAAVPATPKAATVH